MCLRTGSEGEVGLEEGRRWERKRSVEQVPRSRGLCGGAGHEEKKDPRRGPQGSHRVSNIWQQEEWGRVPGKEGPRERR